MENPIVVYKEQINKVLDECSDDWNTTDKSERPALVRQCCVDLVQTLFDIYQEQEAGSNIEAIENQH